MGKSDVERLWYLVLKKNSNGELWEDALREKLLFDDKLVVCKQYVPYYEIGLRLPLRTAPFYGFVQMINKGKREVHGFIASTYQHRGLYAKLCELFPRAEGGKPGYCWSLSKEHLAHSVASDLLTQGAGMVYEQRPIEPYETSDSVNAYYHLDMTAKMALDMGLIKGTWPDTLPRSYEVHEVHEDVSPDAKGRVVLATVEDWLHHTKWQGREGAKPTSKSAIAHACFKGESNKAELSAEEDEKQQDLNAEI